MGNKIYKIRCNVSLYGTYNNIFGIEIITKEREFVLPLDIFDECNIEYGKTYMGYIFYELKYVNNVSIINIFKIEIERDSEKDKYIINKLIK